MTKLNRKPYLISWKFRTGFIKFIFFVFGFYFLTFDLVLASVSDGLVPPPIITLYNKDTSNNEIFYIGGTTVISEGDVIIYIQRSDGAAVSYKVVANQNGEWFYSSSEFLHTGEYIIWTQVKSGEFSSPPSPQVNIKVLPVAFEFVGLRVTYEFFYILSLILFLFLFAPLLGFIIYHYRGHRTKLGKLKKELIDLEQSVRRGFAILKKDLDFELKNHRSKGGSKEEEVKILQDLHVAKKYIDKEIYDIEKLEGFV